MSAAENVKNGGRKRKMENSNWAQLLQEHEAKIGRLAELDSFAENLAQIRHNNDRIAQQLASLQVIFVEIDLQKAL